MSRTLRQRRRHSYIYYKRSCVYDVEILWLLEQQCTHAAHLCLFLDEYLKVLIDDGDRE